MPSTLRDICFDCVSGRAMGEFWHGVIGGELHVQESGDACLVPPDGDPLRYWFNQVPEPKTTKNRIHLDVNMPDANELDRLISLGATPVQEVRGDDDVLWWMVLSDVEGNFFCAFPPKPPAAN
jgi:hypothetical protein